MKSIWKKILSMGLMLMLMLFVTIPAMAGVDETEDTEEPYEITVGGVTFMSNENASGNGWEYESICETLFCYDYNGGPIFAKGDLVITASGDFSKIKGTDGTDGGDAIFVEGQLNLNGIGDFEIIGGDGDSETGTGGAGIRANKVSVYSSDGTLKVSGGRGSVGGSGIVADTVYLQSHNLICGGEPSGAGIEISNYCTFYASSSLVTGQPAIKKIGSADWWYNSNHATLEETEKLIRITPNTYITTLDGNGGTFDGAGSAEVSIEYGNYIILKEYPFERGGYVLIGWSKKQSCEGEPEYGTDEWDGYYRPESNITLYAQWLEVGGNDVLLRSSVGQFDDGTKRKKLSGDTVTLPDALTYSSEDYSLLGWTTDTSTDDSGVYNGVCYLPGDTVETNSDSAMTLYELETYSWSSNIIYHPNGGTLERGGSVLIQSRRSKLIDSSCMITPPEGMEFYGWSLEPNGEIAYLPGTYLNGSVDGAVHLYAVWKPEGTVIQLGTPTELTWGKDYSGSADGSSYEEIPGMISWKSGLMQDVDITVYRENGEEDILVDKLTVSGGYGNTTYSSIGWFLFDIVGSGNYYFTVQNIGDGERFSDSEIATSAIWEYTAPEAKLDVPTGLKWDENTATWNKPTDVSNLYGYEIEWYFTAESGETPCSFGWSGSIYWDDLPDEYNFSDSLDDFWIERNGAGLYYFRVRAISRDLETYCSSDWTELCGPYDLREVTDQVNSALDEILKNASVDSKTETITAIQEMDADNLAIAMAADTNEDGAAAKVEELEKKIDATATIIVTDEASEFNQDDAGIKAVGAGLNATTADQTVIFKIDKPTTTHVLAAQYSNSVEFSMQLVDGYGNKITTEGEKLAVPVKVTLPVPSSISPMAMVVLHHHSDGTTEEIIPYIFEENDTWYATFVVTSFSDFEFANPAVTSLEDGIQVSTQVQGDGVSSVDCAVFDENGKMLGIGEMEEQDGLWTVKVTCDPALVDHVKVFAMDDNNCPVMAEKTITVSESVAE